MRLCDDHTFIILLYVTSTGVFTNKRGPWGVSAYLMSFLQSSPLQSAHLLNGNNSFLDMHALPLVHFLVETERIEHTHTWARTHTHTHREALLMLISAVVELEPTFSRKLQAS